MELLESGRARETGRGGEIGAAAMDERIGDIVVGSKTVDHTM